MNTKIKTVLHLGERITVEVSKKPVRIFDTPLFKIKSLTLNDVKEFECQEDGLKSTIERAFNHGKSVIEKSEKDKRAGELLDSMGFNDKTEA